MMTKRMRTVCLLLALCLIMCGCVQQGEVMPGTTGPSYEDLFPGLEMNKPEGQDPDATNPPETTNAPESGDPDQGTDATNPPPTSGTKPTQPAPTDPPATGGTKPTQPAPTDPPATEGEKPVEPDPTVPVPSEPPASEDTGPTDSGKNVDVERIWMENPGQTVSVGDKVTFYVKAEFKNWPGGIFLFVRSSVNSKDSKYALNFLPSKVGDNVYKVQLTIKEDMTKGEWTANWYFLSDLFGKYVQNHFTEQEKSELRFTVV